MPLPLQSFEEELRQRLGDLRRAGRQRHLEPSSGLDFASNDYLGLATDPDYIRRLRRRLQAEGETLSAPASRLLRGHTELHARLEAQLASFKGTEAALLLPSGFQANVGLLSSLIAPGDRVLSDQLNHASLIDGIRLGRGQGRAEVVIYPHLDLDELERSLAAPWPGRTFVVTESLFSMDGDIAPLDRFADLCERYGAQLIVDDAHATGLWGARGSGLVERFGIERRVLAVTSTFGKAFGAAGAFIAGSRVLIDYLINACRPFIFTTAISPLLCHAASVGLELIREQPERRRRVHENASYLRGRLRELGLTDRIYPSRAQGLKQDPEHASLEETSPIIPVVLGEERRALAVAAAVRRGGFDVRAVRPPTVPAGGSRLRLSVHADHRPAQLDRLVELLAAEIGAVPEDAEAIEVGV